MSTSDQPEFTVDIGGNPLAQAAAENVVSIEVIHEVGHLAQAAICLRNWDPDQDEPQQEQGEGGSKIAVGDEVTISLGYGSSLSQVFDGLVTGMEVQFQSGDFPILRVECRCNGIKLTSASNNRIWTQKSDYDAVSEICSDAGLSAQGSAGDQQDTIVQYRSADWNFLSQRARALGFPLYVRGTEVNFQKASTSGSPVATLSWGDDLWDLSLNQDLRRSLETSNARSWDPSQKDVVTATSASSDCAYPAAARPTTSTVLSNASLSGVRVHNLAVSTPLPESELQALTQSRIDAQGLSLFHGTGHCAGNADLIIDALVELDGLGASYNGNHYVTRVRHCLRPSDFQSWFSVGAPVRPPTGPGGAAQLPPVDGPVLATVVSFEDSDNKQGRVQIKLPWMLDDATPVWARLSSPAAGPNRGFVYIPEPEDEVLVQFLDDDPRFPVVVGALWNGQDAPPDTYDPDQNSKRSIVSKSGHKFVFDDTDDAAQVLVQSQAGQEVLIDDSSGSESIQLADKTGNTIKMDSSGIALTAASGQTISLSASGGTIELSANQITATADMTLEMKANTSASLEGSAQLDLKGAQVGINGDAMIQAQAPMIQLN